MEFEVGDRVVYIGTNDSLAVNGCLHYSCIGTIVGVKPVLSVDWDGEHELFHSAGGLARPGHGWFCTEAEIEHLKTEVDVSSGLSEYAVLYEGLESG